jgi:hypothetical protein
MVGFYREFVRVLGKFNRLRYWGEEGLRQDGKEILLGPAIYKK